VVGSARPSSILIKKVKNYFEYHKKVLFLQRFWKKFLWQFENWTQIASVAQLARAADL
jgi:hypothetical protein